MVYLVEIPARVSIRESTGLQELGKADDSSEPHRLVRINPDIDLTIATGQMGVLAKHPHATSFSMGPSNSWMDLSTKFSLLPEELQPYQIDELHGSGPPERGTWRSGQRIWAQGDAVNASRIAAWVCTEGGTPGKWGALRIV